MVKFSVIIPCYNEAAMIGTVVNIARRYSDDVIVVDNNSSDDTHSEAEKAGAKVISCLIPGAGIATQTGIDQARYPVIVTLDGDGQHDVTEIPHLITPIENGADFVIGCRDLDKVPTYRSLGIEAITMCVNLFSMFPFSDAQCCFRAFKNNFRITDNGFGFSIETLIKARTMGLNVKEVPVSCIYHKDLKANSTLPPVKHGLIILKSILKWRFDLEIKKPVKILVYRLFKLSIRPFRGLGMSTRKPVRKIYNHVARLIIPDMEQIVEINGHKMRVRIGKDRDAAGIGQRLIFDHEFDPMGTKVVKSLVKQGMTFIDVGANVGYYTLLAAGLVGERGAVYSFEPESKNYQDLTVNTNLNNFENVHLSQVAVSNQDGMAKLFVSNVSSGRHSIVYDRQLKCDKVPVKMVKLDSVLSKCDFIKIDTEGNDMQVIEGAENLIKNNPIVMMELYPEGFAAVGYSAESAYSKLKSMFNHVYLVNEWDLILQELDLPGIMEYIKRHGQGCNLLCADREVNL